MSDCLLILEHVSEFLGFYAFFVFIFKISLFFLNFYKNVVLIFLFLEIFGTNRY